MEAIITSYSAVEGIKAPVLVDPPAQNTTTSGMHLCMWARMRMGVRRTAMGQCENREINRGTIQRCGRILKKEQCDLTRRERKHHKQHRCQW